MSFSVTYSSYNLRSSALLRRMPDNLGPNSTVEIRLIKKYRCIARNHGGDDILIGETESFAAIEEFPIWFQSFLIPLNLNIFISSILSLSAVTYSRISPHEFVSLKQQMCSYAQSAAEAASNVGRNSVQISFKVFVCSNLFCNDGDAVELLRSVTGWQLSEGGFRGVPAPISAIEALETEIVDEQNSSEDCRICLDKFFNGAEVIHMPCSHVFHSDCIRRWLEASNSCPLCRAQI